MTWNLLRYTVEPKPLFQAPKLKRLHFLACLLPYVTDTWRCGDVLFFHSPVRLLMGDRRARLRAQAVPMRRMTTAIFPAGQRKLPTQQNLWGDTLASTPRSPVRFTTESSNGARVSVAPRAPDLNACMQTCMLVLHTCACTGMHVSMRTMMHVYVCNQHDYCKTLRIVPSQSRGSTTELRILIVQRDLSVVIMLLGDQYWQCQAGGWERKNMRLAQQFALTVTLAVVICMKLLPMSMHTSLAR